MKMYEQVVKQRLVTFLDKTKMFSNLQAAYRKGRSTVDNILIVQEVFYHYRYKKGKHRKTKEKRALYFGFMDLTKAFDTVPRENYFKKNGR